MSRRLSLLAALAAVLLVAPGSTLLDTLFAQAANGRVTGSVKLTLASTAPSSAATEVKVYVAEVAPLIGNSSRSH